MLKTSIIVPIHNQTDVAVQCIESVLGARVESDFRLILLDDASTDHNMGPALSRFKSDPRVEVHTNSKNLGFTKTVNRGIQLSSEQSHPLLLNSDTVVYDNWLDVMLDSLYSFSNVATVTPLTNQCGSHITCYPYPSRADITYGELNDAELARLAFQSCRRLDIQVHTGVGFCLLINRSAIDEVGLLDEAHFPRGYGEESDFCYRARYVGWRHLVCGGTFVTHLHAQSFGAEKARLQRAMIEVFRGLHPTQPALDEAFRRNDPVRPLRRRLDLARLRERIGKSDLPLVAKGLPLPSDYAVYLEAESTTVTLKLRDDEVGVPNIEPYDLVQDFARLLTDLDFLEVTWIKLPACDALVERFASAARRFQIDHRFEVEGDTVVFTANHQ